MNKSPNGGCHFCKDPENLMHLFVNCKLVDSVWTEIFQKINEFYEQNEIKTISKSENSIILGIHIGIFSIAKKYCISLRRSFLFSRILSFFINSHVFFTVNG
jgi:hypothetical protein